MTDKTAKDLAERALLLLNAQLPPEAQLRGNDKKIAIEVLRVEIREAARKRICPDCERFHE